MDTKTNGLLTVAFLILGVTSGYGHTLEGKYREKKTGYVFEIDRDGYVITDLAVQAEFYKPSYMVSALCTVASPLRR